MSAKRAGKKAPAAKELQWSKSQLDELVEEALTDAYGDSEQASAFYTMLENDLQLPFETVILGVTATVEAIDITEDDQLVAVCRAGKTQQRISLSELPLPTPPPKGAEWIAAYRYWRTTLCEGCGELPGRDQVSHDNPVPRRPVLAVFCP